MKRRVSSVAYVAIAVAAMFGATPGETHASTPMDSVTLDGSWSFETGRLEKFHYFYGDNVIYRKWQMRGRLNCDFVFQKGENLLLAAGLEGLMWYDTYRPATALGGGSKTIPLQNWSVYFNRAEVSYRWRGFEDSTAEIEAGYFPYKYNREVRNLGEYLFRSGAYPTYLITDFDFPMARLLALRYHQEFAGMYGHDLIFNAETDIRPYMDFTATYIGELWRNAAFNPSIGIQMSRLVSVDDRNTTPRTPGNIMKISNEADTSLSAVHDTTFYSFRAIKVIDRLTLDLKKLISGAAAMTGMDAAWVEGFGPEDLKLYYEHAILGVVSYDSSMYNKFGYDNIADRSPVMVGFNVPGFNLLWDVLAVELEYFRNPYPNSYEVPMQSGVPQAAAPREYRNYSRDDFRWSVYLDKSFSSGFSCILQLACDHTRHHNVGEINMDFEEMFSDPRTFWYWMGKFRWVF